MGNKVVLAGRTAAQTVAASTSLLWGCTVWSSLPLPNVESWEIPFPPLSDPHLLLSAYDLNTGLHLHYCLILSCSLAPFPGRLSGPQTPSPSAQTPPGSAPLSLPVGVIHSPLCVWCLLRSAELGIICSQPPQPPQRRSQRRSGAVTPGQPHLRTRSFTREFWRTSWLVFRH